MKKKIKRILKWTGLAVLVALVAWFQIAYWTSTNDCERLAAAGGETMKAIVYCDYGAPDVLKLEAIAKPVPNDGQVLVRVRAASVNPYDWHFMRGEPYIMRLGNGLRKPQSTRIGVDFAGVVEAVGKNVTQFKPGDEVFGGRPDPSPNTSCMAEKYVIPKPENLSSNKRARSRSPGSPRCRVCANRKGSGRAKKCSSMAHPAALAPSPCKLRKRSARM